MSYEIKVADIIIDCKNEKELQQFYRKLLHWEEVELFGHPGLKSQNGLTLVFIQEEIEDLYEPPVWPEIKGKQQKQMHFDFLVPSLAEAVKKALSLGAVKAEHQYGGDVFVTLFDPAGHPFCLVEEKPL